MAYQPPRNQRLDAGLYETAGMVCFITIRAYKHQAPFVLPELNSVVLETLRAEQERLGCEVYAYCLMPSHLHYLIGPCGDGHSVLTFTDQFKGKTTNLSWTLGWRGKLWQPRSYDHIVRREEDLRALAKYIVDNPERRGLIEHAEDWPWGGLMNPLPL